MTVSEISSAVLIAVGLFFFIAGTIGLLRLPDLFARLHALTKADNLGLGFVAAGVALYSASWVIALKLLLIWMLVMLSSAVASHLIAQAALRRGTKPWQKTP
ncbi:MAG: cation:proton antiporter [Gammaproteobacteria bacterium SG8_11]|nr:MAG: cation:proton antiporter [Gammaproteobacteria bacterium SG8_11]